MTYVEAGDGLIQTIEEPLRRDEDAIDDIADPWPPITPDAPWAIVSDKFTKSIEVAEDMLQRLVGLDGSSGYLGVLNDLISEYSLPDTDTIDIDISTTEITVDSRPAPDDMENIDTDFGTFETPPPVMLPLPAIDTDSLIPANPPDDDISTTIDWTEISISTDVYATLLARILTDLVSGATGLDPTVEAEEWARALARQLTENDNKYQEIENYFASRGFTLPPGALAGRLQEAASEISRNNTDLNGKITIEQAQLAQKNSQFIIGQAVELEKLLRATRDNESNRLLDKEKSQAVLVVQVYTERVKAYVAVMEGNKAYIEVQVEVLKGTVEHNKGLISVYKSQADVFGIKVDAKAKVNEAIIGVYDAEIRGYEAETKAISSNQQAQVEDNKAKIAKADVELRELIARIETSIEGYKTEMSLRERISNDMAQIASQSVASAWSATNASASLGYSGSESRNEAFSHAESITQSDNFNASLHESHSYEHDPET